MNNENALYLGRGVNFPVALEGALKLKEISYIHAEGYPSAEMKHGPIALIDEEMPVFFIATADDVYEKIVSNIQEVKARGGRLVALVSAGNQDLKQLAEFVIEVPKTDQALAPLLTAVPLQLLSYHIAVMRDCNVDQPRNLAKSVTVELSARMPSHSYPCSIPMQSSQNERFESTTPLNQFNVAHSVVSSGLCQYVTRSGKKVQL